MRQHLGVDFVGFDFSLGNGAGLERIGDNHFLAEGLQQGDDGPAMGGGFEGHARLAQMLLSERLNGGAFAGETVAQNDGAGFVD